MRDTQKNVYKKLLGRKGESLAVKYLKNNGHKILELNYSCVYGEADIISLDDDVYVFTEVKTRTGDKFGLPSEAVTLSKQKRYVKIAEYYTYKNDLLSEAVRFDVIEITTEGINHIKHAY